MTEWLEAANKKISRLSDEHLAIRNMAMDRFFFFARLMNPSYMFGDIHEEVCDWLEEYSLFGKSYYKPGGKIRKKYQDDLPLSKMIMLPRGHLKSKLIATFAAWIITRHPEITILYLSATSRLAEKQLFDIKNILDSKTYRFYFPEYVHPIEGKRTKWNENAIIIDHPRREECNVRDETVSTGGLTTNIAGWHADLILADDLVVPDNAYTPEGRESVARTVALFTSVRNPGGFTVASGTRYHPDDEYDNWKTNTYEVFGDDGELVDTLPVWEIKEYAVEEDGIFLWPRVVAPDGKAYGFNVNVLSKIRADYRSDISQFYAQYYNDPSRGGTATITSDLFQYYDPKFLKNTNDGWFFGEHKLNVYAAIDFAYSLKKKSDFTVIAVIGITSNDQIFILDIDRFKANNIKAYYDHVVSMYDKWNFKKLNAEVSAAQQVIVNDLKNEVRKNGGLISVEEFRPMKKDGSKRERIAAVLDKRYLDRQIWHRKDGNTPILEDELLSLNPSHDDVKDAVASAISIAKKPIRVFNNKSNYLPLAQRSNRFGGVAFRG